MSHVRPLPRVKIVAIAAILLAMLLLVAGCGKQAASTTSNAATAKSALPVAVSALSTTAPDAKLLVVQTAEPVTTTSTPVWSYLFGSPKSGKTYLVMVRDGKVMQTTEYGTAGLTAKDWAAIPSTDEWKVDSPAAYDTAKGAAKASDKAAFTIGFINYVPASAKDVSTKPGIWYVSFDPATSGATTGTVGVDVKTGAVVTK